MNDNEKTIVFKSAVAAEQVILAMGRAKPFGWGRRSNAPYYNEQTAMWLKKSLDAMIETRLPRSFPYRNFPDLSSTTIRARISQSWQYLRDHLDPDKKYISLFGSTKTIIVRGQGVAIVYKTTVEETVPDSGSVEYVPVENISKWKTDMNDWIDSGQVKPFYKKVILDAVGVSELRQELSEVPGIEYVVSPTEVSIIRL